MSHLLPTPASSSSPWLGSLGSALDAFAGSGAAGPAPAAVVPATVRPVPVQTDTLGKLEADGYLSLLKRFVASADLGPAFIPRTTVARWLDAMSAANRQQSRPYELSLSPQTGMPAALAWSFAVQECKREASGAELDKVSVRVSDVDVTRGVVELSVVADRLTFPETLQRTVLTLAQPEVLSRFKDKPAYRSSSKTWQPAQKLTNLLYVGANRSLAELAALIEHEWPGAAAKLERGTVGPVFFDGQPAPARVQAALFGKPNELVVETKVERLVRGAGQGVASTQLDEALTRMGFRAETQTTWYATAQASAALATQTNEGFRFRKIF